jgi:hypothetical protein
MRRRSALTGFLHLAVLAAPAFHQAFLEEETCAECEATGGPFLTAVCSGPCEDPGHHHHHGRHHDHGCPLCQKSQLAGASPESRSLITLLGTASAAALPAAPVARPLVFAGIHPARAPPSAA